MAIKKDYYKILGVTRNATLDEIEDAHIVLAVGCEPETHPGDEIAAKLYRNINEAFDVLADAEERAAYDSKYPRHGLTGGGDAEVIDITGHFRRAALSLVKEPEEAMVTINATPAILDLAVKNAVDDNKRDYAAVKTLLSHTGIIPWKETIKYARDKGEERLAQDIAVVRERNIKIANMEITRKSVLGISRSPKYR